METWAGIYDALGALVARKVGYDGLWLSSLGLSVGRVGLPDAGFLAHSTVVAATREISYVVDAPLVVDVENGYGLSGSGLSQAAGELFAAGATGLCMEDTAGPKRNSLWPGFARDLADLGVVTRRLELLVGVASRFGGQVIGRTEVLVEGGSTTEACRRIEAYARAGCSAVVVHFRCDPESAMEVAGRCRGVTRLVVIPTAAPSLTFAELAEAGFDVYVAANVAVRAATTAMEGALGSVLASRHQLAATEGIASLGDLDELVGTDALVPGC